MNKYNGNGIVVPGYYTDMPSDIYHAHDSISNSGLKLIARSPAHYKFQEKQESKSRNLVIGSALHMSVLEPDLYKMAYLNSNSDDRRSKHYKDLALEYGGEFVLTSDEAAKIEGISKSVWDMYGSEFLCLHGKNELSGFAIDPDTGVTCRHRFDRLTDSGIGIDLKTTIDARPDAFSRSIQNYGYHMQAAFYSDQYEWITGNRLEEFIFLVVESSAPYACKAYKLDSETLEIGRGIYRKCLNTYAKCMESGEWAAYDNHGIEEISIPQWAINKYDSGLMDNFIFPEDEKEGE